MKTAPKAEQTVSDARTPLIDALQSSQYSENRILGLNDY